MITPSQPISLAARAERAKASITSAMSDSLITLQTTRPHPAVVAAAIALLSAHAAGTWQRNIVWRTEESLWRDVTEKSPRNGRGLMTFGVIQMSKGNLPAAEEYFNRALEHVPQYAYLHVNLGVLKAAQGKAADAERHFRDAQKYDARDPVSYYYYANWLASSTVPKLFVNGDPGSILVGAPREFCRAWPSQREVTVRGSHFLQEDSPAEIGSALAEFIRRVH